MTLIAGYSPTTGETNYSSFNNPDTRLTNAGFVDTGARTEARPEFTPPYAGGAIIYGGVVDAAGKIGSAAPAPDAATITLLSRLIARAAYRPDVGWSVTELAAWAAEHPGAVVYTTHA